MILFYIFMILIAADIIAIIRMLLTKKQEHEYKHVKIEVEINENKTEKDIKMELAKRIIESIQNNTTMILKDNKYIREFLLVDLMEDNHD